MLAVQALDDMRGHATTPKVLGGLLKGERLVLSTSKDLLVQVKHE
jgi:hypothetical protein